MSNAADFDGLRASVLAAVNDAFAEPIRCSFMASAQSRYKAGTPDPDRPMVEIMAVLRVGPTSAVPIGEGMSTMIAAGKAELHIDARRYTGPPFRSGDRVCALSRPGRPWFDVTTVADRGEVRLVVGLGAV